MGATLPKGGPAGLFLGFVVYGTIMLAVNQCFAEMITYVPIASPFVRLAGYWVDDALSFAMACNFFLNMGKLDSTALNHPVLTNCSSLRYSLRDHSDQRSSHLLDRQDSRGCCCDDLLGYLYVCRSFSSGLSPRVHH